MHQERFDFEGFVDSLRQRNVAEFLGHLTDDVTVHQQILTHPIRGKEALHALATAAFQALEEVNVQVESALQDEARIALLLLAEGTYADDVPLPDGRTLPSAGKSFDVEIALFGDLDERGRIRRLTRVSDTWLTLQELGMDPREAQDTLRHAQAAYAGY